MVATVVGSRLGVQQTSAFVLGSRGQVGAASLGRGGENVFVNGMTGNLVVTNRDEFLVGLGPDSAINRSYNSQGDIVTDTDNWLVNVSGVQDLNGAVNAVGSYLFRRDWDGSLVSYHYDADRGLYVSREGAGAYDTISLVNDPVQGANAWKWQDGDTGVSEYYSTVHNRIQRAVDRDGNAVTYTYTGALLTGVTTQDGASTQLVYLDGKLTHLTTSYWDAGTSSYKPQTRTRYGYDNLDRLTSVTVDLSPTDQMIADGKTYVTTYTYEGVSKRVNSISQTDGSRIDITYEAGGAYRVTSVTQSVAQGVSRTTSYTYVSATQTDITDPSGLVTSLEYNLSGWLTKIIEPAATAGGAPRVTEMTYDIYGNVTRVKTSPTTWTDYVYDDVNGDGSGGDHNGLWTVRYEYTGSAGYVTTRRTFNAMNAVLTETRYAGLDTNGLIAGGDPTGAMTTRYVYDSENHLLYSVSAEGDVTQYDYRPQGDLIRTTVYRARFDISGLAWNVPPTYAALTSWSAGLADKSAVDITEYIYDPATGALSWTAAYSNVSSTGGADGGSPATRTYYTYDAAGRLLSRRVGGLNGVETFVYDGMGRMVSAVDYDGSTTATSYLDASGTTVVRQANGLNQVSVFNRAGERVSYTETDRGENLVNSQGWPQGAAPSGAATVPGWNTNPVYSNDARWTIVQGPDGRQVVAMESGQVSTNENGGGAWTNGFTIDPTKAYEFVFYFRKSDLTRHSVYFGLDGAAVENGSTGADNTNPYFFNPSAATQQALLNDDRWYKVVGYVLPQGAGLVTAGSLGGVYDTTTGAKVADTTTFRWNDTVPSTTAYGRFFNYYDQTLTGYSTQFLAPEIRAMDPSRITESLPATGTQYRYDAQGRLRLEIDPTGMRTHSLYDRLGRKVAQVDGDGSLVEFKYDANDRVVATVRYATRLTAAQIASLSDSAGNPTGVELGAVRPAAATDDSWTWTVYDGVGRVVRTIDSVGGATSYVYDGASRLLSQTRHETAVASGDLATFRSAGAATVTTLAGSTSDRISRYFHDANGRQIGALDAEGYLTQITYDSSGRAIGTIAWAGATSSTHRAAGTFADLQGSIAADTAKDIRNWSVYDRRGFLRGTVNGVGEVTLYDYDALGRVTQIIRGRKLASAPTSQPTLDALTSAPIPTDALGAPGVLDITTFTRNGVGQVIEERRQLASGATDYTTYTYDAVHQLVGTYTTAVAGGVNHGTRQRYDRRGRLIGQLGGQGTEALLSLGSNPTKTQVDNIYLQWGVTFTYDDADRLISRTDSNGVNAQANRTFYFYDADGNLAYQVNGAGEVAAYTYDAMNRRVSSITFADRLSPTDHAALKGGAVPASLQMATWSRTSPPSSANVTAIVYTTRDQIAAIVNADTTIEGRTYDAFGDLRGVHNQVGAFSISPIAETTTAFNYDRMGRLIHTIGDVNTLSVLQQVEYDAFGRATKTIDGNGFARVTAYDRAGRAIQLTDAAGATTTYEYDARGNTASVTDRNGKKTLFVYDAFNRKVVVKTPENLTSTTYHDDRGNVTSTTDGGGRGENFGYDRDGNLFWHADGEGGLTYRSYDSAGRLVLTTDASGRKVGYAYDAAGRLSSETVDPGVGNLNLTTAYEYDGKGQRIAVLDPSGVRTQYTFDKMGRVLEIAVNPGGLNIRTVFEYDRAGNVTKMTEAAGTAAERVTANTYDKLNRLLSRQTGAADLNIRSEFFYDKNGNVTKRQDQIASGAWAESRFVYDGENRLVLSVDAAGSVTRTLYDGEGRVTRTLAYSDVLTGTELAALGAAPTLLAVEAYLTANVAQDRSNAFIYDDDGRLVFSVDGVGAVTENVYDGSGNVIRQIRYASLYTASQTPSEADLVAWKASNAANARVTRAAYDDANRQVFSIDAEGFVTAFAYDGAGRTLRTIQYAVVSDASLAATPTEAQIATWATSNASALDRKTQVIYDAAGRAAYVVDPAGYVSRTTYNAAGRVTEQARFAPVFSVANDSTAATLAGLVAAHVPAAATTLYGYDTAGRQVTVTDAMGGVTTTQLNGLGKAVKITDARGSVGLFYYDTAGRLTIQVDPEGYWTQTTYRAGETVATVKRGAARLAPVPAVNVPPNLTGLAGATTSFGYDMAGRLTSTTNAENKVESYTLNAFGDRTVVRNKLGHDTTYAYDRRGLKVSELLPIISMQGATPGNVINQFEYDAFGNMTRSIEAATLSEQRITNFRYDKLDRLTQKIGQPVTVTSSVDFSTSTVTPTETITYDGFGNVIGTLTATGALTLFYYDKLGRKTGEIDAVGTARTWTYDSRNNAVSARVYQFQAILPGVPGGPMPETGGAYRETTFTYDNNNRQISSAVANLRTGQYVDGAGYTTTVGTVSTSRTFDAAGNVTSVTDGRGVTSYSFYDKLGRQVAAIDGEGYLTAWTRDAEGNVTKEVRYAQRISDPSTYSAVFNAQLYAASNIDLALAFRNNQAAAAAHYAATGIHEGRPTRGFDAVAYLLANHDFWPLGWGPAEALTHYLVAGASESRSQYPFGTDQTRLSHWMPPGGAAGELGTAGDRDWLQFFAAAGQSVTLDLAGLQNGVLTVHNANGQIVATSTATGPDGAPRLTFNPAATGSYYVVVSSWSNTPGAWTVNATGVTTPVASAAVGDRITDFTYDQNGRRLTEVRRGVEVYNGNPSNPASLTVADATIAYVYDALGNVTKKTEANGDFVDYGYDQIGRQTTATTSAFTDYLGNSVRRETATAYNGLSAVTRIQDGKLGGLGADARVTTFAYLDGRLASTTDATGFTRHFGYDADGRVVREHYDRLRGDGVTVIDGRRYSYDALGRITLESSASHTGTWSFGDSRGTSYNAFGEVMARTVNGVVTERFSYDGGGRMWQSTAGDGVIKLFVHDGAGNITLTYASAGIDLTGTTIDASIGYVMTGGVVDGGTRTDITATFTRYDGRGLLLGSIEPKRQLSRDLTTGAYTTADIYRSRAYNAFGEVISETDPRGGVTEFTYNTMGRIIEQRRPEVDYVTEAGAPLRARPTEQYRYDISGRLIATRSANGYWTSRTLLAGSGHGQAEAVVTSEKTPDNAEKFFGVDVFGDIRKITNQLGHVTLQDFDKAGRLITVKLPARGAYTPGNNTGAVVQLTDHYEYDGLGQRIAHWNSQFGQAYQERTVFDREGRVALQTDFEGRATQYVWTWDATLATTGLGTFGGWIKTTYHASSKTSVERFDTFGRLTGKTDMGGRAYTMTFDKGGRLVIQTSDAGQSLAMSWYNTGLLARQIDNTAAGTQADYAYNVNGQRVRERYATGSVVRQDGFAEYDELGRMTRFEDRSVNASDPTRTIWTYDLNGNIRSSLTAYRRVDLPPESPTQGGTVPVWNRYDSMNRMVHVEGTLTDGQITGGIRLAYDAAGNRIQMITAAYVATDIITGYGEVWVPNPTQDPPGTDVPIVDPGEPDPNSGHWEYPPIYQGLWGEQIEHYSYTADGYLARVGVSRDQWNTTTDTVEMSGVTWRSEDVRDAAGRVISRWENSGVREGVNTSYSRTSTYDRTGLVLTEQTHTYVDDNIIAGVTAYFRNETVNYSYSESGIWRGAVTSVATSGYRDPWPLGTGSNSNVPMADTTTTYTYQWWDDARLNTIASNTGNTSTFNYDVNGRISTVVIDDDRDRTVTFVTDPNGQVLLRTELDLQTTTGDPKDQYFYFNGQRIGEVTNNGVYTSSYTGEMYNRTRTGPSTPTPFRYGDNPIYNADFDLAYEALTPSSIRSGGSAYTVRTGDTLQGIAAGVWGDSSLWYLIAEANGLTATSLLTAGQTLTIPAKVGNFHNTSDTFRPYDPNKALGDLNPTQVKPPKGGGGGCGVIGMMIAVVIAIAVTAITYGALGGLAGSGVAGAFAAGAIAGTAGSIASQSFLIATGAQDKFNWKSVAISALSAGVAKGLGEWEQFGRIANAIARGNEHIAAGIQGAAASVITEGVATATGLQDQFSWTNVAVAAVTSATGSWLSRRFEVPSLDSRSRDYKPIGKWTDKDYRGLFASGLGAGAAGAATKTLIDGGSFGDNMIAVLPQVIGATIGQIVAAHVTPSKTPKLEVYGPAEGDAGDNNGNQFATVNGPDGPVRLRITRGPNSLSAVGVDNENIAANFVIPLGDADEWSIRPVRPHPRIRNYYIETSDDNSTGAALFYKDSQGATSRTYRSYQSVLRSQLAQANNIADASRLVPPPQSEVLAQAPLVRISTANMARMPAIQPGLGGDDPFDFSTVRLGGFEIDTSFKPGDFQTPPYDPYRFSYQGMDYTEEAYNRLVPQFRAYTAEDAARNYQFARQQAMLDTIGTGMFGLGAYAAINPDSTPEQIRAWGGLDTSLMGLAAAGAGVARPTQGRGQVWGPNGPSYMTRPSSPSSPAAASPAPRPSRPIRGPDGRFISTNNGPSTFNRASQYPSGYRAGIVDQVLDAHTIRSGPNAGKIRTLDGTIVARNDPRLTIEHTFAVVDHWNLTGYNSSRAVRNDFYNETSNMTIRLRGPNSADGGLMAAAGVRYRQDVGPNYGR